jgi:hypothetical protein
MCEAQKNRDLLEYEESMRIASLYPIQWKTEGVDMISLNETAPNEGFVKTLKINIFQTNNTDNPRNSKENHQNKGMSFLNRFSKLKSACRVRNCKGAVLISQTRVKHCSAKFGQPRLPGKTRLGFMHGENSRGLTLSPLMDSLHIVAPFEMSDRKPISAFSIQTS